MRALTDDDLMPFGMHRGKKIKDVPVEYFHFLWHSWGANERQGAVGRYIERSMKALKQENPDLIWK